MTRIPAAFLTGGGEVGALMRAHDWSRSPLGSPENWPQSLNSVVGLLLNSKFPMFVAWGEELGFLYNDSYAEVLGNKHPQALGARFQDIWSEIWGDIHPIVVQAMDGQASYHEDLPLTMNRKGYDEQTWFTFSYSPVRDESGSVAGVYCACTETTEQVLTVRHRAEEVDRLRELFQQAPGIIAVLREPSHIFELANDAYLQLVGHRDIVGKHVREALPELEGQGFFELLDQVFTTGEPYLGRSVAVKLQRQPGATLEERFVDFVYQPIRDHRGRVSGIFVEGSDVTEAIKASKALRDSEQRLRQLANTIPQLAWMSDPDGRAHWFNDRWYEYTGVSPEYLLGPTRRSLYDPEQLPGVLAQWQSSISSGEPFEATFRIRSADGEYRTFFTRAAPLRDAAGNIVQWFGTSTDVTRIEVAQEELKAANRRKDEFLAMLAHELRNPLAPISTAAELLKLGALDEERLRQTSNIIGRQVAHMTKLVDDLLDVSRVTRGLVTLHEENVNLNSVIADAIEQVHALIEVKHQHLTVDVPVEPLMVRGDRTRLIQVFSNLLNNAAKYTPEGGHVALHLRAQQEDVELVELVVQDDGIGIDPSLLPHIFDLFIQAERSPDRSQGGLGLGLALVKSLVELHGGSVSAHSAGADTGSQFIVRLPRLILEQSDRDRHYAAETTQPPQEALQLMVVDDNKDVAQTLCLLLETLGHRVCVAYHAHQALETARAQAPAMLFLDIGLPDVDGYELARRLRAQPETADAVLVALTGYGQPEDRARAMRSGFDHHLVKPVKLDAIVGLLTEFKASKTSA